MGRAGMWLGLVGLLVLSAPMAWSHDIPNQRVDRSTQVTIRTGRLQIDYEISLSELTLTQDLRSLIGGLPGGDRSEWLDRYGHETGPLNAKGFLISRDGLPVLLSMRSFDLVVEEHPRYTFHLEASLPQSGRLVIHDTNFQSSEGTSRLAVRAGEGVLIKGDDLPANVAEIPIRPVWELSDEEERRTRKVVISFQSLARYPLARESQSTRGDREAEPREGPPSSTTEGNIVGSGLAGASGRLSSLLDPGSVSSWLAVLVIAAALGAIHAIQPGHGKSLVSAIALGPDTPIYQPVLLGLVTTLAHTSSVLLIAVILWLTGATQVAGLHRGLTQAAGFAIAAGGFWRLGRHLGSKPEHEDLDVSRLVPGGESLAGLLGLGIAGGLVPCWEAVGLVILSAALGRLGTGIIVVLAFGIGMAAVLVGIGLLVAQLKLLALADARTRAWESQLGLLSGAVLAIIGLTFFLR